MIQSDKESMKVLSMDLGKFNTVCCFFDTSTLASELGVSDSRESILFPKSRNECSELELWNLIGGGS